MSDHPEIQWALDLLAPDPSYKGSFLKTYAAEIVCMASGASIGCLRNWINHRPIFAGLQMHIGMIAAGYVAAQYINYRVDKYQAERDTILRNYVIQHPELFPEPERAKYKDVLLPWHPVR